MGRLGEYGHGVDLLVVSRQARLGEAWSVEARSRQARTGHDWLDWASPGEAMQVSQGKS